MEIIKVGNRKARKNHKCDFCNGDIPRGEEYCYSTIKNEGAVYTWKTHIKCNDISIRYDMYENYDSDGPDSYGFKKLVDEILFNLELTEKISILYNRKDYNDNI